MKKLSFPVKSMMISVYFVFLYAERNSPQIFSHVRIGFFFFLLGKRLTFIEMFIIAFVSKTPLGFLAVRLESSDDVYLFGCLFW